MIALLVGLLLVQAPAQEPAFPSIIPLDVDFEKFLPAPIPPVACTDVMLKFDMVKTPLLDDFVVKYQDEAKQPKTWTLRPGYLISECELVRIINTRTEWNRLKLELQILKDLRAKELVLWHMGEQQYQARVKDLEQKFQKAQERTWWEEWKGEVMFALGVALTAGVVAATASGLKAAK